MTANKLWNYPPARRYASKGMGKVHEMRAYTQVTFCGKKVVEPEWYIFAKTLLPRPAKCERCWKKGGLR